MTRQFSGYLNANYTGERRIIHFYPWKSSLCATFRKPKHLSRKIQSLSPQQASNDYTFFLPKNARKLRNARDKTGKMPRRKTLLLNDIAREFGSGGEGKLML